MNNKKKRQTVIAVLSLFSVLLITAGVTYAFFSYTRSGSTENSITSGNISFLYTENTKIGKGIMLQDAIPMTDDQGKLQSGEGRVFEFSITSKTGTSIAIPYEVTARKSSDSTLDEDVVKIYLEKGNDEVLLEKYSELPQTSHQSANDYVEKVIYNGKVPKGSSNYSESFKLRMWIDENTNYSQKDVTKYYCDGTEVSESDYNTCAGEKTTNIVKEYPYNDKLFKITVNVYANGKMLTEEDLNLEKSTQLTSLSINSDASIYQDGVDTYTTSTTDREITLNVTPKNDYASVQITKTDSTYTNAVALNDSEIVPISAVSRKYTLDNGKHYFKIVVTPEDTSVSSQEYHLQVTKLPGTDATLSSISIPDCPLNETFNSETTSYTCSTDKLNLNVIATTTDPGATYTVSGNTELLLDSNTITITGVAEDGTTKKIYRVVATVTVEADPLQGLALMVYDDAVSTNTLKSGTPDLTKEVETASESGLYKMAVANGFGGQDGITYYFRGIVTNNVVEFAGQTWRIVRINEDGTVRLILDSFDCTTSHRYNKENSMYYSYGVDQGDVFSNARYEMNQWYNSNIATNEDYVSKLATGNYFCDAVKVTNDSYYSGNYIPTYKYYKPRLICTEDRNGKQYVDDPIGMITYDEVVLAGGSPNSNNYKYYLYKRVTNENNNYNWWTMSPGGVYWTGKPSHAWYVSNNGVLAKTDVTYNYCLRPVINLNKNVTATKDENGHYVVD